MQALDDPSRSIRVSAGLRAFLRPSHVSAIGRACVTRLWPVLTARRFPLLVVTHAALMAVATYVAFWLRFDGEIPPAFAATYVQTLPWILALRLPIFMGFGLFNGFFRYFGLWDLCRILVATGSSTLALYALVMYPLGPGVYPRSIVVIDAMLVVLLVGGTRLLFRVLPRPTFNSTACRRVLIIGAGDAGEMIVREMRKGSPYLPVGFIDDDRRKVGRTIHGVTVLGSRADLPNVVAAVNATEVLLAIPSAGPGLVRSVVKALEPYKIPLTTLPGLTELLNGKVGVKHIRPLAVEDLLPRKEVALSRTGARLLIENRCVLVTGGGGSIGSELCRQIVEFNPARLIVYERCENNLYAITNDLLDRGVNVAVVPVIGDITDVARVDSVFGEYRPDIIFHAAAHKHVPLMEENPCEAIKNNVVGTQVVAEAARRHGVERFVLISTDKAANPASVMGATKRVAELIAQSVSRHGGTRFVVVRFGNVLGSNGSVIPRMLDQIRAGGPVTVTHPDIRRYFMLIPEAVSLVLEAAVLADGRETFVLDMGEQIKIVDLARNLITLSGLVPDEDIRISFIGLRPGEKLSEELIGDGEVLESSGTDKIFRVRWPERLNTDAFGEEIVGLVKAGIHGRSSDVIQRLRALIPTFEPTSSAPSVTLPRTPRPTPTSARPVPAAVHVAATSPHV